MSTLISAGVTALPPHRSATGSALLNSGRQIASALGVAVFVTLAGQRIDPASTGTFRLGWLIGAILSAATSLLALPLLRRTRPPAAAAVPVTPETSPEPAPARPVG
jgi:hypothetical protein